MKKTPVYKDVLNGIIYYFTSVKFFFKKEFITQLYWKHFTYSLGLALIPMFILINYFHLGDTPILFQWFVGALSCWVVNWVRENIKEAKAIKEGWVYPYDFLDIIYGSYGGIIATLIIILIMKWL